MRERERVMGAEREESGGKGGIERGETSRAREREGGGGGEGERVIPCMSECVSLHLSEQVRILV